ncbi:MAG: hypothetical protein M5R36_30100 [Deltaproteobacteria bacterium]|nr:hypothetical protein [Deltaproteobacteria bacterium]
MVDGRTVYAFSQDFTTQGGTLGEMHARKITKVQDLALKAGAPVVGFNDSGGARIQEGVDALAGYGEIFFRNSAASGVIPQISAIMGPCAGGAVYSPAMTDLVLMTRGTAPHVHHRPAGHQDRHRRGHRLKGSAARTSTRAFPASAIFACDSDEESIETIRRLLSYLPSEQHGRSALQDGGDTPERAIPALDAIIPDDPRAGFDMMELIEAVVDRTASSMCSRPSRKTSSPVYRASPAVISIAAISRAL